MLRICIFILLTTIGAVEIKKEKEVLARNGFISALSDNFWDLASAISNFKEIFKVISTTESSPILSLLPIPEDAHLNISQLIEKYGYGLEEHKVITEDKYILSMHRLFSKRNVTMNGKVVLLMHGILDSSDCWILQGPGHALGYILADEGYDVWMGNARGNKYSLQHETMNSNKSNYWQFTWEEIGIFDLPAMIDHIQITNNGTLYYIGHSQGTTSFYVLTSMKPEYNSKIKMMFSLAPVSYISHAISPIVKMFSPAYNIVSLLFSGFDTFALTADTLNGVSGILCTILPTTCDNFLYMIVGNDSKLVNKSLIPVIYGHMPAGSSLSQFVHYGQLFESKRFCRYDFGKKGNLLLYNQTTPPDYNLENITVPIVLYYSNNDWLSDVADVDTLKNKLPYVYEANYIDSFNHFDFLFASLARERIYSRILKQIEEIDLRNDTIGTGIDVLKFDDINNNSILDKGFRYY